MGLDLERDLLKESLEHEHRPVRHSMQVPAEEGTKWVSSGVMSGIHTRACCDAYWNCIGRWLPAREGDRDAPLALVSTEGAAGSGPRLRDQIAVEKEVPLPVADVDVSRELTPAEREALDKELEELASKMDSLWKGRADRSEWDEVKADLEVYWLSGETVLEDPRRKETYRQAVLEGLGFGDDAAERRPGMSSDGA